MQMCVAHAFDRFAHAQQNRVRVEGAILDQMTCDRIDRIVLENEEVSAFLQAAVAIADGHLPILRRNMVKDAGSDHQVELCVGAKLIHRCETAARVLPRNDKTFGRGIATDDIGFGKTSRRYGMLRPMPQPKSRTELTGPASCFASSIL